MKVLVKTLGLSNVATRLIFFTGVMGLALTLFSGLAERVPSIVAQLPGHDISAIVQQKLLLVACLLTFAAAHIMAQRERQPAVSFLATVLEFWEFRPMRQRTRTYLLLEGAHCFLIVLMFHRALYQ
jgi:hypothetical protein